MATKLHRPRHDSISDLVKVIRQNYTTPQVAVHDGRFVAVRTENRYYSRLENGGNHHSNRRDKLARGFFSEAGRPYQTVDDVMLEPHALFCSVLGVDVPKKQQHMKEIADVDVAHQPGGVQLTTTHKNHTNKTSHSLIDGSRPRSGENAMLAPREIRTAGLSTIKAQLQEVESRRTAVRAGQMYTDHVTRCQEAREADAMGTAGGATGGMVLRPLSSHHFCSYGNRKYTFAFDLHSLVVKVKGMQPGKKTMRWRRAKQLGDRLDMIYIILTSLMNLKSKHLRTRTPLPHDVVMTLRNPPVQIFPDGRHSHLKMRSVMSQHVVIPSHDHVDFPRRSATTERVPLLPGVTASVKSTPDNNKSFRPNRGARHPNRKRDSLSRRDEITGRVETWDDLVMETQLKPQRVQLRRPWYPHCNAERRRSTKYHNPPPVSRGCGPTTQDVYGLVDRGRTNLDGIKRTAAKQTNEKIHRYRRERSSVVDCKVAALYKLHPLWEYKSRELSMLGRENRHDRNFTKDQTPSWFSLLVDEVAEVGGERTVFEERLERLRRFVLDEPSAVTYAKEKMCLLTLSLPIREICNPVMRAAICFVLENILEVNCDLLKIWLTYRHINLD